MKIHYTPFLKLDGHVGPSARGLMAQPGGGFSYKMRFADFQGRHLDFVAQAAFYHLGGVFAQLPAVAQMFVGQRNLDDVAGRQIVGLRRYQVKGFPVSVFDFDSFCFE